MSSANGTIYFYDKNGVEYSNVFENANNGMEIGNVVQDMYMANEKIYIIAQTVVAREEPDVSWYAMPIHLKWNTLILGNHDSGR